MAVSGRSVVSVRRVPHSASRACERGTEWLRYLPMVPKLCYVRPWESNRVFNCKTFLPCGQIWNNLLTNKD